MIAVGDEAPDFVLKDQNNEDVELSSFRGDKAVLIIFYPLAFTGICTGELSRVRDEIDTFQNDDVQVVTVSVDSSYSHKIFSEREGYDFPLLSDFWPHGGVAQAYGVFNDAGRHRQPGHVPDRQDRDRAVRRDERPGRGARRVRLAGGDQSPLTSNSLTSNRFDVEPPTQPVPPGRRARSSASTAGRSASGTGRSTSAARSITRSQPSRSSTRSVAV